MFTWIPPYQEIARHILQMEDRQGELISGLRRLRDRGLPVITLNEKGSEGRTIELQVREPEAYQYDFPLADIAEVWRRGSVISSWLLDLTVAALFKVLSAKRFQFGGQREKKA